MGPRLVAVLPGDVDDGYLAANEQLEHSASGGIPESVQGGCGRASRHHVRKRNQMLTVSQFLLV